MADFGLVLPEHDLTPQEFKELARRIGRAAFVPLFLRYYERIVTSEATVEEQRRALSDIARWTGVEEDKKVDPNASLPVFNIIFGAPGQASLEAVEVLQSTPALPDPADAVTDVALAMIPPEMLQSFAKEVQHAADQGPSPPSADRGLAAPAKPPRQRGRKQPAAAGAPREDAVPEPAAGPPAAAQPVQGLVLKDPFEDALASLDSVIGLT